MRDSCILYPEVNGEQSKLYKDMLLKKVKNRPLVNYIYASYITSDMADKMDTAGYRRNAQGQHDARDVLNFIEFDKMQSEIGNFPAAELSVGAVDSNGDRVSYTDAKVALDKVDKFNNTYKGLVANVIQAGDGSFNIVVSQRNAFTQDYAVSVEQKLKVWDVYKQAFNAIGVDIEHLPPELQGIVSANNPNFVQQLLNFKFIPDASRLYKNDALLLFGLNANLPQVQKLVAEFGSLDEAAQFVYDVNRHIKAPTQRQKRLVVNAFNESKKFGGLDLNALNAQVGQMMQQVKNTNPEGAIHETLHKLNKKYKINIDEVHKVNSKITKYSDAVTEALYVIERQVREIERTQGNTAKGKQLSGTVAQLLKEVASKKYTLGMLDFLREANSHVGEVDNIIQSIQQAGTDIEQAMDAGAKLKQVQDIIQRYYFVLEALADDNLTIDETIAAYDLDNIRKLAKDLKEYYDKTQKKVNDYTKSTMINLLTGIIGNETPDGQAIINAIEMAAVDSSFFDRYLYSVGRASNPVIAAMGTIIRNAQDARNGRLNEFNTRIKRATDKLYKAGSTSEFMYEDDGHIISDIDWKLYNNARRTKIKELYASGLRGWDLKQAIHDWEDVNTEDRVVDNVTGRTEKVPDSNYRKAFPQLTPAQQEYYDTMMQIKGEIGSLLPLYAQQQYLPPQIRRKMVDALGHAKSVKDVWKAVSNKVQNIYTIREDDETYAQNGVFDGTEYDITQGGFDNTPLRQIPIFFVKPLKDQDELLRNFSTGLEHLAGTALNYDAMYSIADIVEFIGNFAKTQAARSKVNQAELVSNGLVMVVKDLRKKGENTNTGHMVDGFINQYLYGQYRNKDENPLIGKLADSLVRYTSFKGLATNVKGAFANYIMGEFQMMVEAGAGEFYGFKDYAWAHTKLFGRAGVTGEIWDALNETKNSKSSLLGELFDPEQSNFDTKSHQAFHKSMFRKLIAHDLSFIGYGSGEYLIHYVNMYAVLHKQKVKYKGKIIPLYDAFEVGNSENGVSELKIKDGVTRIDGRDIDDEFIDGVRRKIKYVNQTTHGAMNTEDKGLIYQYWYGRLAMNFRQWMVEHYSRRFRGMHFDYSLGENREGYWVSMLKYIRDLSDDSVDAREQGERLKAFGLWMKDAAKFNLRVQTNWRNLNDMQRYNCKRAISEFLMLIALYGLSFALGEPDEHKKEFWRRWWIYQTKRMILDTEASMPNPWWLATQGLTLMNSPFGGLQTASSLMYIVGGLGDIDETIQSGPYKGWNKYLRNFTKYTLPFFKDFEQMQKMDTDDAIFKVFDTSPSGR